MKKWIFPLSLLLCLLLFSPVQADQTAAPSSDAAYSLTYQYNTDGTLSITGYTGTAQGALVLPDTIDGIAVTTVNSFAFRNCTGFTSLSLPEGLTVIGSSAFEGCTGLSGDLTLPESVVRVDSGAFSGCTGFTGSLTLNEGLLSMGNYAFSRCGFTGALILPGSLKTIGNNAFYQCTGLTALTFGESLTEIGFSAFEGCIGLEGSLTLPEGLTSIKGGAFDGCTGLTGPLALPQSLTEIGSSAFSGCTGLTGPLTFGDNLTSIGDYAFEDCTGLSGDLVFSGNNADIGNYAFDGCTGFNGGITLTGVRSIGKYAFRGCTGLNGPLVLGEGLTSIGSYAFYQCAGLTGSLTIPHSVTAINSYAFENCTGFSGDLTIGSGISTIGTSAFEGCSGFSGSLSIGGNHVDIGESAFYGCSGFSGTLTLDSVSAIGTEAFQGCSGFSGDLTLSGVQSFGSSAFSRCGFTGSLYLTGTGNTTLPSGLFYGCGFTGSLRLSGISSIGPNAFADTAFTGTLDLGEGLTEIGYSAFEDCAGFTGSLILPEGLTTIDYNAFSGCAGFTGALRFPQSVTDIGSGAFKNCIGFTALSLPGQLSDVEASTFSGCSGLTGTLTLPDPVTAVGSSAFKGCSGFTGLVIGRGLTSIGASAFEGCAGLTGPLVLSDTITSLGSSAFKGCSGFTALTLGRGTAKVPLYCFRNCSALQQILLPDTITQIESYAFHVDQQSYPDWTPTLVQVLYQGSQEDWAAVTVDTIKNNMLTYRTYDYAPVTPPAEDTRHIGTGEACTADAITIDGVAYPFADSFSPAASGYTDKFLLYTLNEAGAVTSITVLTRSTGVLEDWLDILSAESQVTLSGVEYTFSSLGDRTFLLYQSLLMGQQVIFYRDDNFTVYRIEADPDGVLSAVGYVTDVSDTDITIGYCPFVPGEGISLNEETYLNQFVRYEVRGLNTISALELLPTDTGTLNAFDRLTNTLTIGEDAFALSPAADVEPDTLSGLVGEVVSYVHDGSGTVYHAELYLPDSSTFILDIYRTQFLQDPDTYAPAATVADQLSKQTPGEIMLETMEEEGFTVGVSVWESVTFLADSVSDITNVTDINVMSKDLFTAVLMDALESSTQDFFSLSAVQDVNSVVKTVNELLYLLYQTDELHLKALTTEQQDQIAKLIKNAFYEAHPNLKALSNVGKVFQYLNTAVKTYDSVTDCITAMQNNLFLYELHDSMKEVIRTLYSDAQRYGYPFQLQQALAECVRIVDAAGDDAFFAETVADVSAIAGTFSGKLLISSYWKTLRTRAEVMNPALAILRASYSGTKLLCDVTYNTDDLSDQFWEILATVELEHLIETTRATLATRFQYRGTLANAQAYLNATDLLFSIRCLDCDSILKYVEAVDNAMVSKLLKEAFGIDNEAFKGYVEGIRSSYENSRHTARWGWIAYLEEDYPGQGLEEHYGAMRDEEQALRKQVAAACPVTVSVYDADGTLAAYVSDSDLASFDKNVVVARQGETKLVYLFNRTDYRVALSGNDTGTMDVAVTEYDAGETPVRTARFYDVGLTEESAYDLSGGDSAPYLLTETTTQAETKADLDTLTSPATVSAQVVNGAFSVDGDLLSTLQAPGLQELTVTAMVPPGFTFAGWSADGDQFADASLPSTTFRLPASGSVTLTAALTAVDPGPAILTLDRTCALLRPGETLSLSVTSAGAGTVTWSSLDPQVASVDETGRVSGSTPGTTAIVATAENGLQDVCTVTVRNYGAVTFTLFGPDGKPVESVPVDGPFTVQADVAGGTLAYEDRCLIAGYADDGQLVCCAVSTEVELLPDDVTARLTFSLEGADRPVASLKLFLLSSDQGLQPLGEAGVWNS